MAPREPHLLAYTCHEVPYPSVQRYRDVTSVVTRDCGSYLVGPLAILPVKCPHSLGLKKAFFQLG